MDSLQIQPPLLQSSYLGNPQIDKTVSPGSERFFKTSSRLLLKKTQKNKQTKTIVLNCIKKLYSVLCTEERKV